MKINRIVISCNLTCKIIIVAIRNLTHDITFLRFYKIYTIMPATIFREAYSRSIGTESEIEHIGAECTLNARTTFGGTFHHHISRSILMIYVCQFFTIRSNRNLRIDPPINYLFFAISKNKRAFSRYPIRAYRICILSDSFKVYASFFRH